MDCMTRSLRVFSPYPHAPDYLDGLVSVCGGFSLQHAMKRGAREAELAKDQDDADIPLDLSEGKSPDIFPSTTSILQTVRNIINMCRSKDASPSAETSLTENHTDPSASSTPTSDAQEAATSARSSSIESSSPLEHSPPTSPSDRPSTLPSDPSLNSPSESSSTPPSDPFSSTATADSSSTPHPPKTGRNKRTTTRRKRKRDGVWEVRERAQFHPSTREPLAFPERLVNKYGTVEVKSTVNMNWFSVSGLVHAIGAFIGLRALDVAKVAGWTAESLLETQGFVLVKWDGSKSFALVDNLGHIIARCIGFPPDPNWTSYCEGACAAMDRALRDMGAPQHDPNGRRGWLWTIFTGFSMGGGQKYPMPMDMKPQKNEKVVRELCADPNIRKMAHHGSTAYAFTSPKAFAFLDNVLLAVEKRIEALNLPSLFRPFPFSIFPAVTFNLGRNIWTLLHRDYNNIVFGMCAIHALGNYDYTKGGHLILWDWKVVIEFPPGTTILIPSSAVAHGNTPLANPQSECRKSFTQYIPGGLVRWWRYGFRTEDELKSDSYQEWSQMRRDADDRWEEACGMFSKVDDLHADILEHLSIIPEEDIEVDDMPEDDE